MWPVFNPGQVAQHGRFGRVEIVEAHNRLQICRVALLESARGGAPVGWQTIVPSQELRLEPRETRAERERRGSALRVSAAGGGGGGR